MRKVLFAACAIGLLAVAIAGAVSANESTWVIQLSPGSGGDWFNPTDKGSSATMQSSTVAGVSDSNTVRDTRDGSPLAGSAGSPAFAAFYRPAWMKGDGTDSTVAAWAFTTDAKTPLSNPPTIKVWDKLIVWAAPGFTGDTIHLFVTTNTAASGQFPATVGGIPVGAKIVMTAHPASYNGPTVFGPFQDSAGLQTNSGKILLADISLPSAGAIVAKPAVDTPTPLPDNPALSGGYMFDIIVPEPGSLMVLASGLVGLAGLIRRRSA